MKISLLFVLFAVACSDVPTQQKVTVVYDESGKEVGRFVGAFDVFDSGSIACPSKHHFKVEHRIDNRASTYPVTYRYEVFYQKIENESKRKDGAK